MKRLSLVIACLLAAALLFSACGNKDNTLSQFNLEGEEAISEIPMPISNEKIELSMLIQMTSATAQRMSSYSEMEVNKKIAEKTGIHINYISPPYGQQQEKFNIMVASDDLPDMMRDFVGWYYKGGVEAAMNDGIILDPEPFIELFAPNFKREFLEDEKYAKMVKSDSGKIIRFGATKIPDDAVRTFIGPMVRGDLLEKLNLEAPETIDDWTNMLRRFKNELNIEIPLGWGMKNWDTVEAGYVFSSAYGIPMTGFFVDGNEVKFAPITPEYKEFLTLLNMWYKEGLVDPDFSNHSTTDNTLPAISTGRVGAAALHLSQITSYNTKCIEEGRANEQFIAVQLPTLSRGTNVQLKMEYSGLDSGGTTINANCKYPKEAVMWIDSMYTEEFTTLLTWGVEGEHYEVRDGKKIEIGEGYKDWQFNGILGLVNAEFNDSQYKLDTQKQAWDVWKDDTNERRYPSYTQLTTEETDIKANLMADIETYTDEMFLKFIMGIEPLSKYDEYVEKVKEMGIDDVVKVQQAAYDRYQKR